MSGTKYIFLIATFLAIGYMFSSNTKSNAPNAQATAQSTASSSPALENRRAEIERFKAVVQHFMQREHGRASTRDLLLFPHSDTFFFGVDRWQIQLSSAVDWEAELNNPLQLCVFDVYVRGRNYSGGPFEQWYFFTVRPDSSGQLKIWEITAATGSHPKPEGF